MPWVYSYANEVTRLAQDHRRPPAGSEIPTSHLSSPVLHLFVFFLCVCVRVSSPEPAPSKMLFHGGCWLLTTSSGDTSNCANTPIKKKEKVNAISISRFHVFISFSFNFLFYFFFFTLVGRHLPEDGGHSLRYVMHRACRAPAQRLIRAISSRLF